MDRQQLKLRKYDDAREFHGGLWKPMSWSWLTMFGELTEPMPIARLGVVFMCTTPTSTM